MLVDKRTQRNRRRPVAMVQQGIKENPGFRTTDAQGSRGIHRTKQGDHRDQVTSQGYCTVSRFLPPWTRHFPSFACHQNAGNLMELAFTGWSETPSQFQSVFTCMFCCPRRRRCRYLRRSKLLSQGERPEAKTQATRDEYSCFTCK